MARFQTDVMQARVLALTLPCPVDGVVAGGADRFAQIAIRVGRRHCRQARSPATPTSGITEEDDEDGAEPGYRGDLA